MHLVNYRMSMLKIIIAIRKITQILTKSEVTIKMYSLKIKT